MGVVGTQLQRVGAVFGDGIEILGRYTGDGGEHLLSQLRTNRNMLKLGASQVHHPMRMRTAMQAYADALGRQDALFVTQHVDDVTDAMRHAGASAMVVDRLVQRGVKPEAAGELMRRIGVAHELDSELTGVHRAFSEAMDLHNNELGISLALEHAAAGASARANEQALEGAVLRALADGRGLVLDAKTTPPRASTAADLTAVLRDPSVLA